MYRSVEEIYEGALEHSDKLRREAEAFRLLKKDRRGIRYKLAAFLRALAARVDDSLLETDKGEVRKLLKR